MPNQSYSGSLSPEEARRQEDERRKQDALTSVYSIRLADKDTAPQQKRELTQKIEGLYPAASSSVQSSPLSPEALRQRLPSGITKQDDYRQGVDLNRKITSDYQNRLVAGERPGRGQARLPNGELWEYGGNRTPEQNREAMATAKRSGIQTAALIEKAFAETERVRGMNAYKTHVGGGVAAPPSSPAQPQLQYGAMSEAQNDELARKYNLPTMRETQRRIDAVSPPPIGTTYNFGLPASDGTRLPEDRPVPAESILVQAGNAPSMYGPSPDMGAAATGTRSLYGQFDNGAEQPQEWTPPAAGLPDDAPQWQRQAVLDSFLKRYMPNRPGVPPDQWQPPEQPQENVGGLVGDTTVSEAMNLFRGKTPREDADLSEQDQQSMSDYRRFQRSMAAPDLPLDKAQYPDMPDSGGYAVRYDLEGRPMRIPLPQTSATVEPTSAGVAAPDQSAQPGQPANGSGGWKSPTQIAQEKADREAELVNMQIAALKRQIPEAVRVEKENSDTSVKKKGVDAAISLNKILSATNDNETGKGAYRAPGLFGGTENEINWLKPTIQSTKSILAGLNDKEREGFQSFYRVGDGSDIISYMRQQMPRLAGNYVSGDRGKSMIPFIKELISILTGVAE